MKIAVKDFTIIPKYCPAGLSNCAPCKYAKSPFTVRNPPLVIGREDYGTVDCDYAETKIDEWKRNGLKVRGEK